MNQRMRSTKIAVLSLLFGAIFLTWQTASAGPITNPGGAPYVKAGIYQGVISIVPGGVGESVMEIGNAGRDIASTGSIYLRPGTVGGQGGNVVITSQAAPDEGAEIALLGAGVWQQWNIDIWRNRFRIHTAGTERIVIDGTAGNIYLPTGSLCYGNVGSTNCLTVGGGPGTTPTLDQVLGAGNTGNAKTIFLNNQGGNAQSFGASATASFSGGSYVFLAPYILANGGYNNVTRANDSGLIFSPTGGLTIGSWYNTTTKGIRVGGGQHNSASLSVNNNLDGTGSSGDALAVYANSSTASTIYAQQNGTGYAGYFSGRVFANGSVEIRDPSLSVSFPNSALRVASNQPAPAPGGYTFYARNTGTNGFAAGFAGAVGISGTGKYATGPSQGALEVFVTTTGGTAIYGQGGPGDGSIGVFGHGRSVPAGQSSFGIYGGQAIGGSASYICGDATGGGSCYSIYGVASNGNGSARTYAIYGKGGTVAGGAVTYAGYFEGDVNITGNSYYRGRLKPSPGLQVCEVLTDTCLGRYVYSSGSTRDDSGTGVRYHYDSGSAITSVLVYTATPSPTCPAGWTLIQRGIGVHQSLYTTAGCSGGITTEYVNPGSNPYGNPADPQVCRQNTTVSRTIVGYRDSFTGGSCVAMNSTLTVQALSATTPGSSYSARYELR